MRRLLLGWVACALAAQEPPLRAVRITGDITGGTDLQHAGDGSGRLFVAELPGTIRILRNGALEPQPFLDIRSKVRIGNEKGLLGLVFPRFFAKKQRFYVHYNDLDGNTVIAMYRMSANPDLADPDSETILLRVEQPFSDHKGGPIRFGRDGYLYIGLGDGGGGGDPLRNAQDRGSLLGKILRVDVETEPGRVRIPPDNPFVGVAGVRPEIWALGFRNPWKLSFDRANGDLYIADAGQDTWEEVNYAPASSRGGENYGWSEFEGMECFRAGCSAQEITMPVAVYPHANRDCAVIGGLVYRGRRWPGLRGTYLYGDYCSGRVRMLNREGGAWVSRVGMELPAQTGTIGEDEDGEIYFESNSIIWRIEGSSAPRLAAGDVTPLSAGLQASAIAAGVLDEPGFVIAVGLPLPYQLAGVSVTVNGAPAPMFSLRNEDGVERVAFQTPFAAAGLSTARVVVTRDGASSAAVEVPVR